MYFFSCSYLESSGNSNLLEGYTGDFSNASHFNELWNPVDAGYRTVGGNIINPSYNSVLRSWLPFHFSGENVLYVNTSSQTSGSLYQRVKIPLFLSSISVRLVFLEQ